MLKSYGMDVGRVLAQFSTGLGVPHLLRVQTVFGTHLNLPLFYGKRRFT
jgi:hypothetical protein